MNKSASAKFRIHQYDRKEIAARVDTLAVEEPLSIRLITVQPSGQQIPQNISITMRTPGCDRDLAAGFLFTEGIIRGPHDIVAIRTEAEGCNQIEIELAPHVVIELAILDRHSYVSSSCGVCGKTSIAAISTLTGPPPQEISFRVEPEIIRQLPQRLRTAQEVFETTGGLHASALFDKLGRIVAVREDVGRHNALDKVIGAQLFERRLPLTESILLLSGRASFELIQKAAMAGIPFVAAVGAPSSLAVQLARVRRMTLIGFLRDERFNVYCGAERIRFPENLAPLEKLALEEDL